MVKARITEFPIIRTVGFDGMLVSFDCDLNEAANRAALSFRAALEAETLYGVEESSTSLVSTYVRFDPLYVSHKQMHKQLQQMLELKNWYESDLPSGRRLWQIPTVFGTDLAPEFAQIAKAAGLSEQEAITNISNTQLRVQTIGFAPGQPYLGVLSKNWNIPRQKQLTPRVPQGALVVAICQLVLFSVPTPTGWHHIGQTAFDLFLPHSCDPFVLRAGDEVLFQPVNAEELNNMKHDPLGGALVRTIS